MYASIPDALRALARKIGADANGRNEEEILNNIVVKLGGTPVTNHGVAGSIGAMTKVVDLDVMHNMTTLNVTPTSEAQTIIPESPVDGYSSVTVGAVTAAIDSNIAAGNIKKDVNILGVTGDYDPQPNLETLSVTPTTSAQSITPESPVDGYSQVSVSAVTSAIDQNIVAGNIKKDVEILGVTGSYEGSGGNYNATLTMDDTEFVYTADYLYLLRAVTIPDWYTGIGDNSFDGCTGLTSITIPSSVTWIGECAFRNCSSLSAVTIPSGVETIDDYAFQYCTNLTSVTISSSVESIGDDAFSNCGSLTTITINKAEGSITGAPWGATNATIVWNG